jgi:DNA-binding GntR family transcriptional regulator
MQAAVPTIALLQGHSLSSLVHREIERLILCGELAPGTKLNEAALAERLGVSRGPVREAFRFLEESGLVRLQKNRGAYVRDLARFILEIYAMRAIIDERSRQPSASRRTSSGLRLVDQMDQRSAGDADEYHLLNLAFHDRLIELSGNRKLHAVYRRLINELSLFRRRNLADAARCRCRPPSIGDS